MRTLQAKFNEFGKGLTREEKARIVVGYGDGMFPSHGYTWKTLNTPEPSSTVTCNDCKERLVGCKRCTSVHCRSNVPFKGRVMYMN